MSIDPVRRYQIKDEVSTVKCAPLSPAIGNNQAVITAVSGKCIRVMGWDMQSQTATQASVVFKSASGGTLLTTAILLPPSTALPFSKPIADSGWFQTNSGEGLYVDVVAASAWINVYYVTLTP